MVVVVDLPWFVVFPFRLDDLNDEEVHENDEGDGSDALSVILFLRHAE